MHYFIWEKREMGQQPISVKTQSERTSEQNGIVLFAIIVTLLCSAVGWKLSGGEDWGMFVGGGIGFGMFMFSRDAREAIFGCFFMLIFAGIAFGVLGWVLFGK